MSQFLEEMNQLKAELEEAIDFYYSMNLRRFVNFYLDYRVEKII